MDGQRREELRGPRKSGGPLEVREFQYVRPMNERRKRRTMTAWWNTQSIGQRRTYKEHRQVGDFAQIMYGIWVFVGCAHVLVDEQGL